MATWGDGQAVTILILEGDAYMARETSIALSGVTRAAVSHFVEESKRLPRAVWLRNVRDWVRQRDQ